MKATNIQIGRRSAIRPSVAAIMTALLLAGCGSGHVGDSWQCPLAQGGSCTSVAAADPAVAVGGGGTRLKEPLWKPRVGALDATADSVCTNGCGSGSGPIGWLGRLLGGDGNRDIELEPDDDSPEIVTSALAEPASGTLQAGHAQEPHNSEAGGTRDDASGDGDLRTGEVVARIWIAPFVDGNGVYREAGHVRVVLEPAAWRTE